AGMEQGKPEPELTLQAARGGELRGGEIEADGASATPRQPRRDVARPAAELDGVQAGDRGKQAESRLGNAPDAPPGLGACPVRTTGLHVVGRPAVPDLAVAAHVVWQVSGHATIRSHAAPRRQPSPPRGADSEPALVDADDAGPDRVERQLHAITDAQLLEDVVDVRFDRHLADAQLPAHLGIAESQGDVAHDLALPPGEG